MCNDIKYILKDGVLYLQRSCNYNYDTAHCVPSHRNYYNCIIIYNNYDSDRCISLYRNYNNYIIIYIN